MHTAVVGLICVCMFTVLPWVGPTANDPAVFPSVGTREDSLTAAIEKDRQETREWLKSSPTSYLATINRVDFAGRPTLTVGRGEQNDLRIDDPHVALRHLRVTVAGDSFKVESVDPGAVFTVRGAPVTGATLPPSAIGIGKFILRLSHQRFPALIVFDPSSPRFREYHGIAYFPVDLRYRFEVSLHKATMMDTVVILSSRGNQRKGVRPGWFDFTVDGTPCRLAVIRLLEPGVGEKDHSIFFRDLTCDKESYPMGRYVEAEMLPDGRFVLDFNMAYSPACAYSLHYNCPVPPEVNHLPVRIPAGEMDSKYVGH